MKFIPNSQNSPGFDIDNGHKKKKYNSSIKVQDERRKAASDRRTFIQTVEMKQKSFRNPKFPECCWVSVSLRHPEVALSGASERLQNGGGINLSSVHAKAEKPPLSAAESSLSSGSLRSLQHLLHQELLVQLVPSIKGGLWKFLYVQACQRFKCQCLATCTSNSRAQHETSPAGLIDCLEPQALQTLIQTCQQ